MIIILSNTLTNNLKEKIVNATYETSKVMPVFLDYAKPIRDLAEGATIGAVKYIKIPGDDIVKINADLSNKLTDALEAAVGKGCLVSYLFKRKAFQKTDIEVTKIINNFDMRDEEIFRDYLKGMSSEKTIYIGGKGEKSIDGIETIELTNEAYEDIAIEIQEKLGATEFVPKTLDEIAMEKLDNLVELAQEPTTATYVISTKTDAEPIKISVPNEEPVYSQEALSSSVFNDAVNNSISAQLNRLRGTIYAGNRAGIRDPFETALITGDSRPFSWR